MDYLVYIVIRAFVGALGLFPVRWRIAVLAALTRASMLVVPRFKSIAKKNIALAFPDKDAHWQRKILEESYRAIARLLVDFARLGEVNPQWVSEHVECSFLPRFIEIKKENPGKGVIIASGHLGSFELLAQCVAMYGYPASLVVRLFKLKRINQWWTSIRERYGNRVISREGAFKHMMKEIISGKDVAILFDQNVKRNHAVFVDWFGRPAATTKSVAIAALRTKAVVVVTSIIYVGNDKYEILASECDFSRIYADQSMTQSDKILEITKDISIKYQAMIRQSPAEWFWMHRRWKTALTDAEENFYS